MNNFFNKNRPWLIFFKTSKNSFSKFGQRLGIVLVSNPWFRWNWNQPKTRSGKTCVLAYRILFTWANLDCNGKYNYICERPVRPTNHHEIQEGCGSGWVSYGNRCYKFEMQQKIYYWAKSACSEQGAALTTVYDAQVNAWLHAQINQYLSRDDHVSSFTNVLSLIWRE